MGKTRDGVYHNLKESTYYFNNGSMVFFFSSMLYLTKFRERYKKNRENMGYTFEARHGIKFNCDDFYDLVLYKQIEKRGFRVKSQPTGEVFECLNNIILDGEIKTLKNLTESSETSITR